MTMPGVLDLLIPKVQRPADFFGWATVVATSPLQVRLDGETDPLDATPDSLVTPLHVGERVWVQIHGKRLVILGGGGASATAGLPPGGTLGQVLSKASGNDYDTTWATPLTTILSVTPASSALLTAYPLGVSLVGVASAFATSDGGFPYPVTGQLVTERTSTSQATQYWSRIGASYTDVWVRTMYSTANTPWAKIAGDIYRTVTSTVALVCPDSQYTLATWAQTEQNVGDLGFSANCFVAPTAGLYHFTGVVTFNGGVTAAPNCVIGFGLGIGGGAGSSQSYRVNVCAPGTGSVIVNGAWDWFMGPGDSVGLFIYHTQGANRTISARRWTCRRVGNSPP